MPINSGGQTLWLYSGIRATNALNQAYGNAPLLFAQLGQGPTTGPTLTARSVTPGHDILEPTTSPEGIPPRFLLPVEAADCSANGGQDWFDIGTTERGQLVQRVTTAEAAAVAAQIAAENATGPAGPAPVLQSGSTTTLPAGSSATSAVVPLGNAFYRVDFGVPRGADGTGTGGSGTPDDASVTDAKVATTAAIQLSKTADSTANGGRLAMTSAERTKLASSATGATANATDAQLRDRGTHSGFAPISATTGLETALAAKLTKITNKTAVATTDADLVEVQLNGAKKGWLNEWGALRGLSPYSWGDALLRAIRQNSDGITQGNAIEIEDRRTGATALVMYGRRWLDGRLVRNGNVMADVFVVANGATPPASLPEGTVVIELTA